MVFEAIKCDGCGKTKGEANRWLIGAQVMFNGAPLFGIGDWPKEHGDNVVHFLHFCGETCALKRQAEFLRQDEVFHG